MGIIISDLDMILKKKSLYNFRCSPDNINIIWTCLNMYSSVIK